MQTLQFHGSVLADGRKHVEITDKQGSRFGAYTTVRNIDGSNRLMSDSGLWSFLPYEYEHAAWAAIAKAEGRAYVWAHCVPAAHIVA